MAVTVTATQGGSTFAGMVLRVFVLTGAAAAQNGATSNNQFVNVASFTQSITTTQTGSRVYGASSHFPSAAASAAAATTVVDDVADAANNGRYTTFKATSLTGTPGATTLGYTVTGTNTGPFAQAEIKTAGTLAEDASAPAVVSTTAATAVTTASFTPPAGSLLVALVGSDGGAAVTTMAVTDTGGGYTWTELVKNNPSAGDYAGVWIAQVPAAGGGVTYVPQRYGQAAPMSPAPWAQRDRRDANTAATAANPLPAPLDSAWGAGGGYWHLYGDSALRDRRQYFCQRPLVSDPALLTPAGNADPLALNPEQSPSSDLWRVAAVPAFYPAEILPQQRSRASDPLLLSTALLENELLGGADTSRHAAAAAYMDRRLVPQQRPYISDPSFYPAAAVTTGVGAGTTEAWWGIDSTYYFLLPRPLSDPNLLAPAGPFDPTLGGLDDAGRRARQAATHYDRREVPQQRPYLSDPAFYPTVAPTDPLTLAWGAGGGYWHLYNRAAEGTDRREVPQQRAYVSDPAILATALLENELLGGAGTWQRYGVAALAARWWMPQQRAYVDPLLLTTAELENELLGGAGTAGRYLLPATHYRAPAPPPPRPPGAAPDIPYDPALAAWAETLRRALIAATHYDRRQAGQQRAALVFPLPPVPFDPLLGGWARQWLDQNRAATHTDRRLVPQQRWYVSDPLFSPSGVVAGIGDIGTGYAAAGTLGAGGPAATTRTGGTTASGTTGGVP